MIETNDSQSDICKWQMLIETWVDEFMAETADEWRLKAPDHDDRLAWARSILLLFQVLIMAESGVDLFEDAYIKSASLLSMRAIRWTS